MVYLACFQLLYEFFSHEKFYLWRLEPDPVFNYTSVVMLHTFCIYPLTAFLYLTRFPEVEWKAAVLAATAIETSTRPSGKRLLENRYEKVKQALQNEKEKNEKLLEICRKHVIEKAQLKSRIEYLENKIQELRDRQLKPLK